jgi:hypothetical protein
MLDFLAERRIAEAVSRSGSRYYARVRARLAR